MSTTFSCQPVGSRVRRPPTECPRLAGRFPRTQTETESRPHDSCGHAALKTESRSSLIVDSAEAAIVAAVNIGDDTDTVGAVTGAVAGARFGVDSLPDRWVEPLNCEAALRSLATTRPPRDHVLRLPMTTPITTIVLSTSLGWNRLPGGHLCLVRLVGGSEDRAHPRDARQPRRTGGGPRESPDCRRNRVPRRRRGVRSSACRVRRRPCATNRRNTGAPGRDRGPG
ncbi:ADP-ribosylglycohydrolase family protein [Halorientalis sp.]|uniref:ADP-ribosylglycohydrolase family protein n=1 Tax=Halorientalis sp. TaxID=1931229 RepID=UPI0039C8AFD2